MGFFSGSKQGKLLPVLTPLCFSKGPNKAFPELLVCFLINFCWWKRPTTLVGNNLWCPKWGSTPTEERIWAPLGHLTQLPHGWQKSEPLASESPQFVNSSSLAPGASVPSLRQCFSLAFVPFRSPPFPLSLSWNLSTFLSVLSFWKSGLSSCSITPLSSWDLLPLAGNSSPWWVTSGGGRGLARTLQTLVQGPPTDWRFMRRIQIQTSYPVVTGSLILLIFSPLFSCCQEKSHRGRAEAADFYTLVYVRPTCGLQPHTGRTIGWSRLFHPSGQETGAPSFTSPFWKRVAGCLSRHPQGMGWNGNLSVCLFFAVFSVPPPFTSPSVLNPYSCPLYPENFSVIIIGISVK